MPTARLRKVGGSVMLAVPPALLEMLHVQSGDEVDVTVESGRLVAQPQRRKRYTLDELLAQCDPKARRPREDREWISGGAVGGELI